jgi:hypothetical protein
VIWKGQSSAVIGIGINLKLSKKSMSHIDQPAIDLVSVGLEVIDPNELLGQILKDLADVLGQFNTSKFSSLKEEWMSYHVYQHQTVTLSLGDGRGVTGLAQGVTDDGALIIETPSAGIETFSSGEITLRKSINMFLLIDIGNTRTKWMLRDNKSIYKYDSFLTEDIDQDHFEFDVVIKKILISNVAGFEKEAILKIKLKKFSCPVEFIKAHKKLNHLINNYQDATKLGTDRWLSALSVSHEIKKTAVIVSVGTAVTIDYVSFDEKKYQHTFEGGVILPGLHLTKNALANNTADLKSSRGCCPNATHQFSQCD